MGFLDRLWGRAARIGAPGDTARVVGQQYLVLQAQNPQTTKREIFETIANARHAAQPYTTEQLSRLETAVDSDSLSEFVIHLLLIESNLRAHEIQGAPLQSLVSAVNDELRRIGLTDRTRAEWLARFLSAYWGATESPEGLAAKLRDDLSLERVNPDELWAYFAFVVAHTALANDFSHDDINRFFNLAAMERGGTEGCDELLGLAEKRLPQYVETFSNLALLVQAGMQGGVIAAMREVAENIAGESELGLRSVLASMTTDVAARVKEFLRTVS